jgi:hypothetical protein
VRGGSGTLGALGRGTPAIGGGGGGGGAAVVVFVATASRSTVSAGFSSAFASSPFSPSLPAIACLAYVVSVGSGCAICTPVR